MRAELDATRKRFSYFEQTVVNVVTGITRRVVVNNADSVAARVQAIIAAIDEAQRLKVELADQTEIPQKLGALAAALPVVEDPKIS